MHLLLPSFVALIVFASSTAEQECLCHFPDKFKGTISIYSDDKELLKPDISRYEVDLVMKRAVILPPENLGNNSMFIQDLENKTLYEFPYLNGRLTGKCTGVTMPTELLIPSCVPSNWTEIGGFTNQRVFRPDPDSTDTEYILPTTTCKAYDLYDAYYGAETGTYYNDIELGGFTLLFEHLLNTSTSSCAPLGHFDSVYARKQ